VRNIRRLEDKNFRFDESVLGKSSASPLHAGVGKQEEKSESETSEIGKFRPASSCTDVVLRKRKNDSHRIVRNNTENLVPQLEPRSLEISSRNDAGDIRLRDGRLVHHPRRWNHPHRFPTDRCCPKMKR
jgi:hypothetical protein